MVGLSPNLEGAQLVPSHSQILSYILHGSKWKKISSWNCDLRSGIGLDMRLEGGSSNRWDYTYVTLTLTPLWITFCTWCGLSGALRSHTLLSSLRMASTGCFAWGGVVENIIAQEVLDREAKIGLHWSFLGRDLGNSEVTMSVGFVFCCMYASTQTIHILERFHFIINIS